MAKGKKCPDCGGPMRAELQTDYPAGTEVTYQCIDKSCGFEEKVFEDKRSLHQNSWDSKY
jgi:hypothetical protein